MEIKWNHENLTKIQEYQKNNLRIGKERGKICKEQMGLVGRMKNY